MNKKGYSRGTCLFMLLLFAWRLHAQVTFPGKYQHYIDTSPLYHEHIVYLSPSYTPLKDEKPYQFAKAIPVSFAFDISTVTSLTKEGDWHWRIKIRSPGASSLSLIFHRWWIPEDAEVYVYNDEEIRGAFKAAPSNKKSRKFATTPLKGDTITVEYFSPAHVKQLPQIEISRVVHGFRQLLFSQEEEQTPPQTPHLQHVMTRRKRRPHSGKCNVDLSCDAAGTDWHKEADAVAVLLTNENQVYCTGVLLNNAEHDGRPLLLTAHHCTGDSNPETDIIMFNYERRSCRGYVTKSLHSDTLHGLTWLTGSPESDYALFEIQEPIPSEYNVYLAGWTTQETPISPLVGIHHPKGDFKKLSIYNGQLLPTCWSECPVKDHWKIERWTRGTTEPGSSGSPLFDANHHVVGQLHGGSASCWNKNGYDVYGSLAASWQHGLHAYLDPKNQTIKSSSGSVHMNGIYFNKIKRQ